VQTRYRFEKKVTAQLQGKGLQTFLPVLTEAHRWNDRQKRVEIPLFSGYTFAQLDASSEARKDLLRTRGVIGLVTFAGEPVPVPARQISDLQCLLSQRLPCSLHPFLKTGERVRVRGGSLDGLEGILERKDEKRLVIAIDSIQRAVAIQIAGYELELI